MNFRVKSYEMTKVADAVTLPAVSPHESPDDMSAHITSDLSPDDAETLHHRAKRMRMSRRKLTSFALTWLAQQSPEVIAACVGVATTPPDPSRIVWKLLEEET